MMNLLQLLAQNDVNVDPGAGAAGLLGGGFCVILWLIVMVAVLAVWIYALVDAIKNPNLSSNERMIWILVIIFTSWIGALVYLIIGRKKGSGR